MPRTRSGARTSKADSPHAAAKKYAPGAPIDLQKQRRLVDYGKCFRALRHPETWSCTYSGTTEDVVLLLGTGQVSSYSDASVPPNGCRLALRLGERPFHIIDMTDGYPIDVSVERTGLLQKMRLRCAALQRTVLGSAAGTGLGGKESPWEHLRRYVRLFSLPFFKAESLRRRRLDDLRAAAELEEDEPSEGSTASGGESDAGSAAAGMSQEDEYLQSVLEQEQATLKRILKKSTEYRHEAGSKRASSASSSSSFSSSGKAPKQARGPTPPGFTGLRNLGNTCYMNSTLQCLSSCVPLRRLLFAWRPPIVTSYEEYLGGMAATGQPYGMFRAASIGMQGGPSEPPVDGAGQGSSAGESPALQAVGQEESASLLSAPKMLRLPSEVVRAFEFGGGLRGGSTPAASLGGVDVLASASAASSASSSSSSSSSKGARQTRQASTGTESSIGTDRDSQRDVQGSDLASVPLGSAVHGSLSRLWMPARLPIYTPQALLSTVWRSLPRFAGFRQHDVDGFLRGVLERLDEELRAAAGRGQAGEAGAKSGSSSSSAAAAAGGQGENGTPSTPIGSMFTHETVRRVRCRACGHVSATRSSAIGPLLVDIPARFSGQPRSRSRSRAGEACTLRKCLEAMCEPSALEGDCKYQCDSKDCKGTKQEADIWVSLGKLPPVLPVTIVRTEWTMQGRVKKQTHVEFPLDGLQLADFDENGAVGRGPLAESAASGAASNAKAGAHGNSKASSSSTVAPASGSTKTNSEYSLVALIEHHGKKPTSGHYTSIGRRDALSARRLASRKRVLKGSDQSDAWVDFNDVRVKVISPDAVRSTEASMLMYVRSDLLSRPRASGLAGELLHRAGFVLPPTATVLLDKTGDGHADVALTVAPGDVDQLSAEGAWGAPVSDDDSAAADEHPLGAKRKRQGVDESKRTSEEVDGRKGSSGSEGRSRKAHRVS